MEKVLKCVVSNNLKNTMVVKRWWCIVEIGDEGGGGMKVTRRVEIIGWNYKYYYL